MQSILFLYLILFPLLFSRWCSKEYSPFPEFSLQSVSWDCLDREGSLLCFSLLSSRCTEWGAREERSRKGRQSVSYGLISTPSINTLMLSWFYTATFGSLASSWDFHNVRRWSSSPGNIGRQGELLPDLPPTAAIASNPSSRVLTPALPLQTPITSHTCMSAYDSLSFPDGIIFFVHFNSRNSSFTFTYKHKYIYI